MHKLMCLPFLFSMKVLTVKDSLAYMINYVGCYGSNEFMKGKDMINPEFQQYQGYVLGWGTMALFNSSIAQLHGRSALAWFFISLLLGPIATLYLLFTYKK
jgi:hypothetical protein